MRNSASIFPVGTLPESDELSQSGLGVVVSLLIAGVVAVSAAHAGPQSDQSPCWPQMCGVAVSAPLGERLQFQVEPIGSELVVGEASRQSELGWIELFLESSTVRIPNLCESVTLAHSMDACTGDGEAVSLSVETSIIAVSAVCDGSCVGCFWGVRTSAILLAPGTDADEALKSHSTFTPLGRVDSIEEAGEAVLAASAELAQSGVGSDCFSDCMALEHARIFDDLESCLLAVGIGVGVGANVCALACLGSGPGYPACVLSCLGFDGLIGTGVTGYCVLEYISRATGAAIGCRIGCWGI